MTKDDYHVMVCKVLLYLYKCLKNDEKPDIDRLYCGTEEYRAGNPYHGTDGRFTSAPGGGLTGGKKSNKIGKTKYAPSPQRNKGGIQLTPKTYARLAGTLNTRFPGLEVGEIRKITDAKYRYTVETDGYGGFRVLNKKKI